jgi:hypothetical protein
MTDRALAFVFTGESNSGGIGLNSEAAPTELAVRPRVQIMNLTSSLFGFEPLRVGVNNLRDHAGLEDYYDSCHGFEIALANSIEAGLFTDFSSYYLIKLKSELPGTIIIMTQFQSMSEGLSLSPINQAIAEIADAEDNVFVVNSNGADLRDTYHWSYAGLKTVGSRMAAATKRALNLLEGES